MLAAQASSGSSNCGTSRAVMRVSGPEMLSAATAMPLTSRTGTDTAAAPGVTSAKLVA